MYFETLQGRLLKSVRWRVQNGELTERGLAGMVGISQPHMHNVLKGARTLSPAMADRILRALEMSVLDLFLEETLAPPTDSPWTDEAALEVSSPSAAGPPRDRFPVPAGRSDSN